jgi:hypothetical protein
MARKIVLLLPFLCVACGSADSASNQARNAQIAEPANGAATVAAPDRPEAKPNDLSAAPLTPEGWGPLKIGMTIAEITAALGPDADPEGVGGADPASCDQYRPARAPDGMLVMVEGGRLTRISLIDGAPVRTDRGLAVGSTRDAVAKAYGAAAVPSSHKYAGPPAGYLDAWIGGGGGDTFTAPPSARGIRYEIDEKNVVNAIHAGGPSIQYVEGCS